MKVPAILQPGNAYVVLGLLVQTAKIIALRGLMDSIVVTSVLRSVFPEMGRVSKRQGNACVLQARLGSIVTKIVRLESLVQVVLKIASARTKVYATLLLDIACVTQAPGEGIVINHVHLVPMETSVITLVIAIMVLHVLPSMESVFVQPVILVCFATKLAKLVTMGRIVHQSAYARWRVPLTAIPSMDIVNARLDTEENDAINIATRVPMV